MKQQQWIHVLLFLLMIILFFFQLYRHRERYIKPYDFDYYADQYLHSQYVEGEGSKYIVSDYDLYSFAGHYYFTGGEVSRVNFENPPLGKYLLGLSIYLFNNQVVIYIAYALLYLWITYKFGILLLKRFDIGILALVLLVIDPYFLHAMSMPLLDLPMATFFLIGLYLFTTARSMKWYVLSSVFFGISIATKFFPFFAVILLCLVLYQWRYRRQHFWTFILTLPIIFLVYIASFFEFFINRQQDLVAFFQYQWWVIRWRMGNPIVVGNILNGIFFGREKIWWTEGGGYVFWTEEWSILMPITVITAFASIFILEKKHLYKLFYGYVVIFMTYIIFLTEGGLKYLAPLYPFFALFTAATLIKVGGKLTRYKRK
ncbi:MAG: hypothetical protein UV61_C0001G0098 [Candidatus Gottesmanbacteria bacterium GW2011_GWB1_43_11]|uniref:Glycosyltransferase RgtA/B/C/D-like domain-containing protein n=1 Tax=Candidatus Gottesmanbacteria bacterium GW2011_GWB1_43_11 TaxID=1618446 RepID=A0A0G1EXL7_9BACT|nr:MAG: hypothetical protein UV04_C0004G0040 [Candidatus Gottesmanbacteria bacterium GW2011_GWA2_42_16]KKS56063.1 MAG: hypothetical protein UV17_C0003G0035 [Candidatus Gottesmanbacteria bacterium GW2011_GWA1_42_26]KKS81626.1 MAG: hypothetical protein UV55_C0011G0020 [Candidatus Gottesmanbacteria bacterium GW2011_GWC1_43_10]KKS87691.1 MAG: hypothetical protein UV61_C0001G0098 [Candidatus Gottesmanbacteria bacterium GW2011_GWB1_43_11]HCM37474.1 hypothetical protein [Patescibacteria group bacteriu